MQNQRGQFMTVKSSSATSASKGDILRFSTSGFLQDGKEFRIQNWCKMESSGRRFFSPQLKI